MDIREKVYLYNGALLDGDGECAMPIPHLFANRFAAQQWADDNGIEVRVVKGVRRGDAIVEEGLNGEPCVRCAEIPCVCDTPEFEAWLEQELAAINAHNGVLCPSNSDADFRDRD